MISLSFAAGRYSLIAIALNFGSVALLALTSLLAGGEANVLAAQSAIADVITSEERNRFFGYTYLSARFRVYRGPLGHDASIQT
jgi:hypothetical protein